MSNVATGKDLEKFLKRKDRVFLVSFPRSGSHWLRMMCELASGRPTFTRSFYPSSKGKPLFLHTHDYRLSTPLDDSVIYLYRNAVETVFSQVYYDKQAAYTEKDVVFWATHLGLHFGRWKTPRSNRLIIKYEDMKADSDSVVASVLSFCGVRVKSCKIAEAVKTVTKDEVASRTEYDSSVLVRAEDYAEQRVKFSEKFEGLVGEIVSAAESHTDPVLFN